MFEWAWQQPTESRRLKDISGIQRRRHGESHFEYNFRILAEMLRIGPWNRLPLTIRWLSDDFVRTFPAGKSPPIHMPICHGRVRIKAITKPNEMVLSGRTPGICKICSDLVDNDTRLDCLTPNCRFVGHLQCLAKLFLEPGQYIPIEGFCPCCKKNMLWGNLIRKKKGCSDLEKCDELDMEEDFDVHFADDEDDGVEFI